MHTERMMTMKRKKLWEQNCKDCLFNGEDVLKSQQSFKSFHHKVYTEEVNQMALSSDDDNRLQTFDRISTYPYGTTNEVLKVFETERNIENTNDQF